MELLKEGHYCCLFCWKKKGVITRAWYELHRTKNNSPSSEESVSTTPSLSLNISKFPFAKGLIKILATR
jgi:hypothetical protein